MRLPPPLRQLYDLWMAFSRALGKVMSFLILTILWIVGFGIYALVLKVIRLMRKDNPASASFWLDVPHSPEDSLRQQF